MNNSKSETGGNKRQENANERHLLLGEFFIFILLFVFVLFFFIESLKYDGVVQGVYDGPGAIPQIMLGVVLILIIACMVNLIKPLVKMKNWLVELKKITAYLLSLEVVVMSGLILLYAVLITKIGFIIPTVPFLLIGMLFLNRERPLLKLIVSIAFSVFMLLLFRYGLDVYLP